MITSAAENNKNKTVKKWPQFDELLQLDDIHRTVSCFDQLSYVSSLQRRIGLKMLNIFHWRDRS